MWCWISLFCHKKVELLHFSTHSHFLEILILIHFNRETSWNTLILLNFFNLLIYHIWIKKLSRLWKIHIFAIKELETKFSQMESVFVTKRTVDQCFESVKLSIEVANTIISMWRALIECMHSGVWCQISEARCPSSQAHKVYCQIDF